MLIFRGKKLQQETCCIKGGIGSNKHSEFYVCGTVMARIAFTVHHWYLLIAPLYLSPSPLSNCYSSLCAHSYTPLLLQLFQDLSGSLNFSVVVTFPQHQAQPAYAWRSQAGLSSVLEFLCPRILPNILKIWLQIQERMNLIHSSFKGVFF